MDEKELAKEAEQALNEIDAAESNRTLSRIDNPVKKKINPFTYILALILLLLIIMMVVPFYGIQLNPEPKNIPLPQDVMPVNIEQLVEAMPGISSSTRANYNQMIIPGHQSIRNMAAKIATTSCPQSDLCYAKAMFYFIKHNFQYVGDPPNDYLESPFDTLKTGGADCDGLAILLANLESAIGLPVRLAFIPGHVYVQIKIDSAPNKYKEDDGWISLDPTCNNCEFGEIPYTTMNKNKEFLYIQ